MQNWLVVGDLQAKQQNLPECVLLFEKVENLAKEKNINKVIWLGDMLDVRGRIEAVCLNTLFNYFSSSKLYHYIVVGNHDLLNLHTTEHSLEPLKAIPNVNIYDKPGQLGNMLFMPYYRDADKFLEDMRLWLTRLPKNPILVCHQGIKEFTIGSGYTENEAIGLSDVPEFSLVVAGHYHAPKDMANVCYLGSPFSHSFGESNEHKRLGILNTETAQIEFIPTDFRRHVSIDIDLNTFDFNGIINYNSNDLTRAIVTGTEEQIEKFKLGTHSNSSNLKFIYRPTSSASIVKIQDNLTNKEKWLKWSKEIKQLDESTINAGLELL